ncbi:MAG: protein methyltransferase [Oceanospirillales bacterium LUC14_002_19_P2]|nr:MAG: protein methyltransferase [Oceanospirillales bacterium LUC14_002_19_P2]
MKQTLDISQLNRNLIKMHPEARVLVQPLPDCPQIQLALLDPAPMKQRPFKEEEIKTIQEYPAYWAFCWGSGQALAAQILDTPGLVAGKTVMDFGAGSGVVAIAACLAGAREVIACYIDPDALLACQINARINQVNFRTHDDLFSFDEPLDMLIAADVLYDRNNLPLLEQFNAMTTEVLVADSRVKVFDFPPYQRFSSRECGTVPDLDETRDFNKITQVTHKTENTALLPV